MRAAWLRRFDAVTADTEVRRQQISDNLSMWKQPATRETIVRHLEVIADMFGHYDQKDKLHKAWSKGLQCCATDSVTIWPTAQAT